MSNKKFLENLIRRILKEEKQNLTEAMKSEKLRKLTSYLPKGVTWRGITDKFHIALDQVTDDAIQVVKGPQAKKILSSNPESIGFFIWNGEEGKWVDTPNGLMGVKQGTKFVSFYDQHYYTNGSDKDSSAVRGYTRKGGGYWNDAGIRGTVGSSKTQSYGRGRYRSDDGSKFTAGDYWSENVIVYIIDPVKIGGATTDLKKSRSDTWTAFKSIETFKSENLARYRDAIAKIRSTQDPEFIKEYQEKLDILNAKVNAAIQKVLADPVKYRYSGLDHSVTYGKGRDQKTYTTSLLKLMADIYYNVDKIISAFKNAADDWSKTSPARDFEENYKKIMSIVNSINNTSAR